jgi:hypothetical protein
MTLRPTARLRQDHLQEVDDGRAQGSCCGGKTHRATPDFGPSLTVSSRDSQSNCWVNWKVMGQPCEFQVVAGGIGASGGGGGSLQTPLAGY